MCNAMQVLKNLEPYIQQALEMVDMLKEEDERKTGALEDMICQFREMKSSREAKMADVATTRNVGPVQMTGGRAALAPHSSCRGGQPLAAAAFKHAVCAAQRLQLPWVVICSGSLLSLARQQVPHLGCPRVAGNMTVIVNEVEGYIKATAASGGAQVTALKQGYLLKRSSGMRREWKRRFFVLDSAGMLYYYSNKVGWLPC